MYNKLTECEEWCCSSQTILKGTDQLGFVERSLRSSAYFHLYIHKYSVITGDVSAHCLLGLLFVKMIAERGSAAIVFLSLWAVCWMTSTGTRFI